MDWQRPAGASYRSKKCPQPAFVLVAQSDHAGGGPGGGSRRGGIGGGGVGLDPGGGSRGASFGGRGIRAMGVPSLLPAGAVEPTPILARSTRSEYRPASCNLRAALSSSRDIHRGRKAQTARACTPPPRPACHESLRGGDTCHERPARLFRGSPVRDPFQSFVIKACRKSTFHLF